MTSGRRITLHCVGAFRPYGNDVLLHGGVSFRGGRQTRWPNNIEGLAGNEWENFGGTKKAGEGHRSSFVVRTWHNRPATI
jgi:hypothetical protein